MSKDKLELEHQQNLVDLVIGTATDKELDTWIGIVEADFWYNLEEGYLSDLKAKLEKVGVDTDSIDVMLYLRGKLLFY